MEERIEIWTTERKKEYELKRTHTHTPVGLSGREWYRSSCSHENDELMGKIAFSIHRTWNLHEGDTRIWTWRKKMHKINDENIYVSFCVVFPSSFFVSLVLSLVLAQSFTRGPHSLCVCVCVFLSHSFILSPTHRIKNVYNRIQIDSVALFTLFITCIELHCDCRRNENLLHVSSSWI